MNSMVWKVHTSRLLTEILSNEQAAFLEKPLNILSNLLAEVGERAAELNDPELNKLMMRLAIYSIADPDSPGYDSEAVSKYLED